MQDGHQGIIGPVRLFTRRVWSCKVSTSGCRRGTAAFCRSDVPSLDGTAACIVASAEVASKARHRVARTATSLTIMSGRRVGWPYCPATTVSSSRPTHGLHAARLQRHGKGCVSSTFPEASQCCFMPLQMPSFSSSARRMPLASSAPVLASLRWLVDPRGYSHQRRLRCVDNIKSRQPPVRSGAGHVKRRVAVRRRVDGQRVRAVSQQEADAGQMPARTSCSVRTVMGTLGLGSCRMHDMSNRQQAQSSVMLDSCGPSAGFCRTCSAHIPYPPHVWAITSPKRTTVFVKAVSTSAQGEKGATGRRQAPQRTRFCRPA